MEAWPKNVLWAVRGSEFRGMMSEGTVFQSLALRYLAQKKATLQQVFAKYYSMVTIRNQKIIGIGNSVSSYINIITPTAESFLLHCSQPLIIRSSETISLPPVKIFLKKNSQMPSRMNVVKGLGLGAGIFRFT